MDPQIDLPKTPEDNTTPAPAAPRRWTGWIIAGGLAVVVAGAGIGIASDFGGRHMKGGFGGPHLEHGVERVLDKVDATPEQEKKFWAIVDAARAEAMPVVRDMRASRGEILELLASPTIDRAKAETMRADRIAALDAASRKMTTALLDAAEVLTPEQRAKIAAEVKQHEGRRW